MTGQINISGSTASVQLKGNDRITTDQTFTFPDAGGELVVTPGTADIETSGDITVAGNCKFGSSSSPTGVGTYLRSDGESRFYKSTNSADGAISTWASNTGPGNAKQEVCRITGNGSITANGTLDAGRLQVTRQSGTYQVFQVRNGGPSATKTAWIQADGNASFVSTRSANVFINLDPDNPQNYVSTANKETGETEQVYSGPTLDVRQVLLDLQSKVEALQAEIQTLKGGAS